MYPTQIRLLREFAIAALMLGTCGSICLGVENLFQDRVTKLLAERCLSCHSGAEPQGGFSVQTAEQFFEDGYVEPGNAAESHLVDLISSQNGKAEMPKDAKPLSTEEVAVLVEWINAGAHWPTDWVVREATVEDFDWWSYQPLQRPTVPPTNDPWAKTPIDQFILETLREQGLRHSPPADRQTLIRRLTYDLTGLPPTPEEVAAFVADADELAYEKLVDRLLNSVHYGEHWARHWLDIVKYADSCGYDKDKLRPNAWPYRDYVIRSLNSDKAYGRFVQEQIAGDVLFPGEPDGIVGLGFIAAGPWDFIGHVEVSEEKLDGKVARNLDRDDMVSGAINSFCSLTVQCARCHNHKFDPITQEQYYGLQAVFAAVDRADRAYDIDANIAQKRTTLQTRFAELSDARGKLESEIAKAGGETFAEVNARIDALEKQLTPIYPEEHGYHSAIASSAAVEKWVEVELPTEVTVDRIVLNPCSDDFAGIGDGFGFPLRFKVEAADDAATWQTIYESLQEDFPNPGIGEVAFDVASETKFRRVRVTATRLATRSNDYIFSLAELQVISADANVAHLGTVSASDSIEAPIRWARQNLVDGKWPHSGAPAVLQQLQQARAEREQIYKRLLSEEHPLAAGSIGTSEKLPGKAMTRGDALQAYDAQLANIEEQLQSLPAQQRVYAATTSFDPQGNFRPTDGRPRQVHVLTRGEVGMPGEPASPGVIPLAADADWKFSDAINEGERRRRLALWLTDREHPLVWRSIVNRVWQYHFGEGIVATPNDFGRMGAEPTHPELLDWLAVEFRDSGQSLKKLHRLIVTSNTYQQASADVSSNMAIDGSNQYLWRANRRRLTAEEVRDSILTVSGRLNRQMGGPGYYLFTLEKTEHSPHFEYHKFDPSDPASHRRSVYRFIARSQPNPYMTTLDCADSSQSTPKRNETLTSLQALTLLNNKFNLAMAEAFAERLQLEQTELRMQVERAVALITQREPSSSETEELTSYAQDYGLPNLCRLLFNMSEFVFVD